MASPPRRASLLLALGAAGCSAPSSASPHATVTLPEASATAAAPRLDPSARRAAGRGWVKEQDGTVHRASRVSCSVDAEGEACRGDERFKECHSDADCKAGPHGRCLSEAAPMGAGQMGPYCGCRYGCVSDDECGAGRVCVCGDASPGLERGQSTCAVAACLVDADCPDRTCGLSVYHDGCTTTVSLACRSRADPCRSDEDCGDSDGVGYGRSTCHARGVGEPGQAPRWQCGRMVCAPGRPLMVEGGGRTAALARGVGWA